ncbi:nucleotidyltransferase family protein [Sediminibacterium sp.]|uniref:nucleotidyltransferase family protein n=1 Tax=Sediminibacterium sp. TaxID=1917865 RepID=UPI0025CBC9FC|nr:nucleotidyltransferase family protein [Sediminibacterium sp.]
MSKSLQHIISTKDSARDALRIISGLPDNTSLTLFVLDDNGFLKGTITDGDIRRGLLNNLEIFNSVDLFMNKNFKFFNKNDDNQKKIKEYRNLGIELLPFLDEFGKLIEILDLEKLKTILPISVLLMAGGKGERLKPLTDATPKPMLKVGDKPIIEHNLDRLISFGVKEFFISVKYLKHAIIDYLGDGSSKGVIIKYVEEDEPLGTLGALSLIDVIENEDLLVMNSDILTNIDFEDFFSYYKVNNSELMLASIPYNVAIPYAVLKTNNQYVYDFEEKPNYTYYSNGGIYLMKTKLKDLLPRGKFFNATDLMSCIMKNDPTHLAHYPLLGYWLDIGKHQDYLKAQEDIKHIRLA